MNLIDRINSCAFFVGGIFTIVSMNNFLAVQNLKMALKSKHFTTYWLKAFSSDTPQSIKRQNKGPKEHNEKYIPSCGQRLSRSHHFILY